MRSVIAKLREAGKSYGKITKTLIKMQSNNTFNYQKLLKVTSSFFFTVSSTVFLKKK